MTVHHDPRRAARSESRALADLIDARARRLIGDAGEALGVPVHLTAWDPSGATEVLVGDPIPDEIAARAAWEPVAVEDGRGRFVVQRLAADGHPVGLLAFGPLAAGEPGPVTEHLARLVAHHVTDGLEHAADQRRHAGLLADRESELHHVQHRLSMAATRLDELSRVKASFLATVSHELRTPLTSVIGYSEMLLEGIAGPLSDEQRRYVAIVMEKGDQLLQIITGILDVARIEARGVSLDCTCFDIADTIATAVTTVAPAAQRKRLQVATELPSSLPKVRADREKVRQVLVNLLGNAVKFTPEGGRVTLRADLSPLAGPASSEANGPPGLRISVADSGIGIPTHAMSHVFEPFYQVDSSATREHGGTGLGLSIVRSFVTAHGGVVWVESEPGSGSTFHVTLPLAS